MSPPPSPTSPPFPSSLTGAISAETVDVDAKTVRAVVSEARRSFESWSRGSFKRRKELLDRLRRQLAREAEGWAGLITEENGKPILESLGAEVWGSLEALHTLIQEGEGWLAPRPVPLSMFHRIRGVRELRVFYEPLGVIGIIGTWNYPLGINLPQIAGALLCGNTVVWKPSELSPKVADRLKRFFRQAGFPDGVFTALPADRAAGEALVDAGCDKIIFTGQGQTGRRILSRLAEQGIPAVMELSGMDAALVCRRAPWPVTVRALAWGSMTNSGQSCVAARRLIVDQQIFAKFVPAFVERVRLLRVGDPKDPATEIGPVRSREHLERLEHLVADAVAKGALLLTGGRRIGNAFFEPTVLTGLNEKMVILREEFFGPVALVLRAGSDEQMVRLANDSAFGLGASVWTEDLRQGRDLAAKLQAGVIWINDVLFSAGDAGVPFGGIKRSGFGRVGGPEGLRQLVNIKRVEVARPSGFRPYYFPYSRQKYDQLRQSIRWRHA